MNIIRPHDVKQKLSDGLKLSRLRTSQQKDLIFRPSFNIILVLKFSIDSHGYKASMGVCTSWDDRQWLWICSIIFPAQK